MKERLGIRMTILILTVGALIHPAASGALTRGNKAAPSSDCAVCEKMAKLAAELRALNPTSDDDRFKGGEKALVAVGYFEKFEKLSARSKERLPQFKALLALIREAGPYDGESMLADMLAAAVNRDAGLKAAYEDYGKSLSSASQGAEACKNQRLEKSVAQAACFQKQGEKAAASAEKCIQKFNFDECLKKPAKP